MKNHKQKNKIIFKKNQIIVNNPNISNSQEKNKKQIKTTCYACSGSGLTGFRQSHSLADKMHVAVCLVCSGTGYKYN